MVLISEVHNLKGARDLGKAFLHDGYGIAGELLHLINLYL